ncbi:hypothetical protein HV030_10175 [Citrobacter freundii]|nr:hypothetical protein [Citrobacter freundii]QMA46941.1 hypothetical protein HV030_10175 [Citrobacter freundii]
MNKNEFLTKCRELLIQHGRTEVDVVWLGDMSEETILTLLELHETHKIRVTDFAPGGIISKFALI